MSEQAALRLVYSALPQIKNIPPLPDRLATALAPYLPGATPWDHTPPRSPLPPTAAAAATEVSSKKIIMDGYSINRNSVLDKEKLARALKEAGLGKKPAGMERGALTTGKGSGGSVKNATLGRMSRAIEVRGHPPGRTNRVDNTSYILSVGLMEQLHQCTEYFSKLKRYSSCWPELGM